jgi:hypothetical protein
MLPAYVVPFPQLVAPHHCAPADPGIRLRKAAIPPPKALRKFVVIDFFIETDLVVLFKRRKKEDWLHTFFKKKSCVILYLTIL